MSASTHALVGTWTSPQSFVPVACPIGGDATATTLACPPGRSGWDEVNVLTISSGGQAVLTFPGLDGASSTSCTGVLATTTKGVGVDQLVCHGPAQVEVSSYAAPAKATVAGGCLSFPPDAKLERDPGDCSGGTSGSTVTFGSIGGQ